MYLNLARNVSETANSLAYATANSVPSSVVWRCACEIPWTTAATPSTLRNPSITESQNRCASRSPRSIETQATRSAGRRSPSTTGAERSYRYPLGPTPASHHHPRPMRAARRAQVAPRLRGTPACCLACRPRWLTCDPHHLSRTGPAGRRTIDGRRAAGADPFQQVPDYTCAREQTRPHRNGSAEPSTLDFHRRSSQPPWAPEKQSRARFERSPN
jgi:hypothetical protein